MSGLPVGCDDAINVSLENSSLPILHGSVPDNQFLIRAFRNLFASNFYS